MLFPRKQYILQNNNRHVYPPSLLPALQLHHYARVTLTYTPGPVDRIIPYEKQQPPKTASEDESRTAREPIPQSNINIFYDTFG